MLGASLKEVWSETWSVMGPQIERVMSGAGATWAEDHLVMIPRFGKREEIYWTYSFSPIDDAGAPDSVGGVMVLCMETTKKVRAERQLAFQLALSDKLRRLSDASEIMLTAAEMVGRQLGAGRGIDAPCRHEALLLRLEKALLPGDALVRRLDGGQRAGGAGETGADDDHVEGGVRKRDGFGERLDSLDRDSPGRRLLPYGLEHRR